MKQANGHFKPNLFLLQHIPTPAIAEIIVSTQERKKGIESTVSHLGLVYRQQFQRNDLIYHKISCGYNAHRQKECKVNPIFCQKDQCNELMFTHATNAYPNNFVCTLFMPKHKAIKSYCNRVERLPFFDYLIDSQYGVYRHMSNKKIIGIHFEKLSEGYL